MITVTQIDIDSLIPQLSGLLTTHAEITLAYLYGSAANGTMTPLSDVDIALVIAENLVESRNRLEFELAIANEIAEQTGLGEIDARIINDAPIIFRGQVVTFGIPIFARDEEARVEFETRTRSEYFDFMPVADRLREAFFEDVRQRGLDGQRA